MIERASGIECLSALRCDQLLNGEVSDGGELAAHCASCARCTERLAAHRRERAAFSVPLRGARPPRRRAAWTACAAAAVALGVWLVVSRAPGEGGGVREGADGAQTRTKGRPAIGFYVKHQGAVRRGGAGEIVFADDALNFTASTSRPAYLAIISIDGARTASVYYPDGPAAAPLPAGQDQVLPLSVVLDRVLGTEQIHGVFCDRPAPAAELAAIMARGAALPAGCTANSLRIEKRGAP